MKSPEQRKTESEIQLHKRGIRINVQLPLIESDEEVELRSADDVFRRLVALWAVSGALGSPEASYFRDYVTHHRIESWLSSQEREFMHGACADEVHMQLT